MPPLDRALPWLLAALLGLVAWRTALLLQAWRRGAVPGTRLVLPGVVLAEGLGLTLTGASAWALRLRLGTALALELLLLGLAVKVWREAGRTPGGWPEDRLAAAFSAFVPPQVARLMALELVLLGSAFRFLAGGFRTPAPEGFSHHREAALRAFLPAVPLLIPGDVLLMKVLFADLAPWLRWALHGSTVYAVLWLVGWYATLKARPHQLREGWLHLRLGLLKSVSLPAAQVLSAAPLPDFPDDWARHAHLRGVPQLVAKGAPALELTLAEPVRVLGLLGPGRPTVRLVVSVDEPAAFRAALGIP